MAYLRHQYFDAMAYGKSDAEMERFHRQVDRLAMIICEEQGLDPWKHVAIEENTVELTPYEARGIDYVGANLDGTPLRSRSIVVTRWNTFRRQAALLIAGHKALTKYLLTEA